MTAETISLGSCPTCLGPAQFIDDCGKGGDCTCVSTVRHVELPNIEADLGDGWTLRELHNHGLLNPPWKRWEARATNARPDQAEAFGETPSQAYLALRTAIEARA